MANSFLVNNNFQVDLCYLKDLAKKSFKKSQNKMYYYECFKVLHIKSVRNSFMESIKTPQAMYADSSITFACTVD